MTEQPANGHAQGIRSFIKVLRNKDFFWLWIAQLISIIGDFFSFLAVPYFITVLAQGPAAAGAEVALSAETKALVGLAEMAFVLPRVLGIFTGVFIDRWNRQRVMIVANLVAAAIMLIPLAVTSLDAVWLLVLMQFLLALTTRFIQPTQQAALPQILPERDLLAANGLMLLTFTVGMILGPMVAGVTVELFGVKTAFVLDSLTFVVAGGIVAWRVRIPKLANAPGGEGVRAVAGNIWEGLRHLFTTPVLLATTISLALLQGGIGSINAMWVPYMRETFGVGPIAITTVDSVQGLGMAAGAVALGFLVNRMSKLMMGFITMVIIGLAIAGIGLAPSFGVVVGMAFFLGLPLVPGETALGTLLQLSIPKNLQGRVQSSFQAITQTAGVLSIAVVTGLVTALPLRAIFTGGGVIVVLSGVLWLLWAGKDVRALEARIDAGEAIFDAPVEPVEPVAKARV